FKLSADGKKLHYKVDASGVGLVSQAHLHVGAVATTLEGQHTHLPPGRGSGPIVGNLLDFVPAGLNSGGTVAEGVLTAADLSGPLSNYPLSALADHLSRGWVYVNVHVFHEAGSGQRICCPGGMNGAIWPD
ncbi:MAG: CHRD domain-containing protein, partial [Pseudomonadota bacterium]